MLEIRGIQAGYAGVSIIRDVSLDVHERQVVSLLGANGAGKSTLLKVVNGLLKADAGVVTFCGEDITNLRPDLIAERGLIQVPQGRRLFTRLSVIDNLLLGNSPRRARPQRNALLERVLTMFPILAERRSQLTGTLSGGQQQMVAIGRALMGAPRLLVLDEPSIGLSPSITQEVLDQLTTLNRSGLTVLLVEQNVAQALSVSNRGYILENGAISLDGEADALRRDERIRKAYLGV